MTRNELGLRLATNWAHCSPSRVRVGAVVLQGNRVLGGGCNNMLKSHPLYYPAGIHAELAAVLNAAPMCTSNLSRVLSYCTIYVVRLNKRGDRMLAKPCFRCEALINQVGIRKVVHS
jgi:deoxycytidylate deaminase